MLQPVDLPPGIFRNGTRYQTRGRWYDANLVRWVDGVMRPVGGWSRITTSAFAKKARTLFDWVTNDGSRWLAIGTSNKLLVNQGDANVYDVTPVGFIAGSDSYVEQLGYGAGNYGASTYGTPRAGSTIVVPPASWQLDSWGEYLVACARGDGKLYQWTLSTGTPAAVITNAPTNCLGLIVSDQRHIIAFGAGGNRRKAQWCDKEDNTIWTPGATNEAGSIELQTNGEYVRSVRVRGQILVVTTVDAHVMNYIGQPYIYGRDRVGLDCGLIGPNAIGAAESFAVWMGDKGFWKFDGGAVTAVPCEVSDFIFTDLNTLQGAKVACGHNGQFGEMWWFYPSSGQDEPDRYVVWNYREKHWSIGALGRTAWRDKGVFPQPLAIGTDNHLYRHEEGYLDNGASLASQRYVESGVLEFDNGDLTYDVFQTIPDEKNRGDMQLRFNTRFAPNDEEFAFGPYTVRSDGLTDTRFSGRQIVMRLEPTVDTDWRVGRYRLDVTPGSPR